MSNIPKYYWDSSIFCMILGNEPGHGQDTLDSAVEILHRMETGRAIIISSQILEAEILESKNPPDVYQRFQAYLQRRNMHLRAVDHAVAIKAAAIRDRYVKLKIPVIETPDALHLATALLYADELEEIHSVDAHFPSALARFNSKLKAVKPFIPKPPPAEPPAQLAIDISQGILIDVPQQQPILPASTSLATEGTTARATNPPKAPVVLAESSLTPQQENGSKDGKTISAKDKATSPVDG